MARYASMTDVVFGNTLTGRTLPIGGVETIDGPTIATVPVRVAFKLDQTVHSLLESVQRDGVETIPFEQLGMQEIKKVSEAARQACGFQSMLTIQNYKPANKTSEASVLKPQHARVNLSHLLSVDVTPMGSEVEFLARFDGQVLGMQQVRRLLYQMHHVITQLWNVDSRTTVRDIELLSHQDRQDIARWNDYPVEAIESDLPTLIAQRTFTQPASPAVRAWDGDLTYLELQQLSDNVASHLRDLEVCKGQQYQSVLRNRRGQLSPCSAYSRQGLLWFPSMPSTLSAGLPLLCKQPRQT
jgi:non-ribosomal peptide synthetase component F